MPSDKARTALLSAGYLIVLVFLVAAGVTARTSPAMPDRNQPQSRLRIEVTGGDDNQHIAEASVYIKFAKDHKSEKGKLTELNVKTNQEGIAQSPQIPQGKILIQIIAPGWKTYGEWHDITEAEQNIQIHLIRPTTKWY